MNCTTRLKIGDINKNFICVLCGGYYVDATTIIECLHSFCRTCIVTYLKTSKSCPVCDTIVHKTRPHQNIRSDKLLQDLVYKLVPGLYKDEMRRRREFYTAHYDAAPKRPGEERGDEMSDRFAYTEEENISLALHFCPDGASERVDFRRVFTTKEEMKVRMEKRFKEAVDVRYLQCKAAVTVGHLKKFVRLKYGLPPHFQVDMFYNDEPLRNSCSLCDVAFFFNWTRRTPLMLTFSVYESARKDATHKKCPSVSRLTPHKIKPDAHAVTATTTTATTTPAVTKETETHSVQPAPASAPSLPPVSAYPCTKTESTDAPPETLSNVQPLPNSSIILNNQLPLSVSSLPVKTETLKQPTASSAKRAATSAKSSTSASKRSCDSNTLQPGPSKHPARAKTSSLGKRPATTPIPIAPAPVPAKIAALGSSLTDIARSVALDSKSRNHNYSGSTNLVSLLPVEMAQLSLSKVPITKETSKQPSTITFSMSSILNAVSNRNNVAVSSKLAPVSLTTVELPTATSGPYVLSSISSSTSSHEATSAKPKIVATTKPTTSGHNQPSRNLETAFSSSCSSVLSVSSSAMTHATQASPVNSVASPTPATSASPTPAAVPIQQSQTQGSDILHPRITPGPKQSEQVRNAATKDTNPKSSKSDQCHVVNFKQETRDSKMDVTATNNQSQNKSSSVRVSSATLRAKSQPVWISSPSVINVPCTNSLSVPSTPSTPIVITHSMPDKPEAGSSPATSPTSNGPTCSGLSGTNPKQTKQKKIADIANTLHKRMSDALLTMVGKRASSPSNRKGSQSATSTHKPNSGAHPDTREKTASSSLPTRPDLAVKHSLQNVPPSGHVLNNFTFSPSIQTDEPLNLVKRDQEIVRLTNGMFILDIPPSST